MEHGASVVRCAVCGMFCVGVQVGVVVCLVSTAPDKYKNHIILFSFSLLLLLLLLLLFLLFSLFSFSLSLYTYAPLFKGEAVEVLFGRVDAAKVDI